VPERVSHNLPCNQSISINANDQSAVAAVSEPAAEATSAVASAVADSPEAATSAVSSIVESASAGVESSIVSDVPTSSISEAVAPAETAAETAVAAASSDVAGQDIVTAPEATPAAPAPFPQNNGTMPAGPTASGSMTTSSSGSSATGTGGSSSSDDDDVQDSEGAAGALTVQFGLLATAAAGLFAFLA